jgi:hypothetical protein
MAEQQPMKMFYVALKVAGSPDVNIPVKALNQESVSHMAAIACAVNFPNINGYLIFGEDKQLLENVNAMDFIAAIAKDLQARTGRQVLKTAVPLKGDISNDEWNKMVEDARQKGKLIEGTGAAAAAAPAPPPGNVEVILDKK